MFTLACCFVSDGLFRKIHFHLHLRIGSNRVKKLLQEFFCNNYRKNEVVQLIILMNIGKETWYHYTETITGNCPGCMLAAGTRTEILSGYQNLTAISRIIQYKWFDLISLFVITPVAKQIFSKPLLRRRFQKTCRYNLVWIYILQWQRYTCTCQYIEFCFHLFYLRFNDLLFTIDITFDLHRRSRFTNLLRP